MSAPEMSGDEAARRGAKSAAAFRTISEVADELAVPQHVLRFWETKFPQIRPLKRGGGRRYYRPEDVELLRKVSRLLYHEGYTIKGVQRLLREGVLKPRGPGAALIPTLPLGLEELDDAAADEDESLEAFDTETELPDPPAEIPDPVFLRPKPAPASAANPAVKAILREVLDELLAIRDLLPPRRD